MDIRPTPALTPQERTLMYLLVHGQTAAQAARELGMDDAKVDVVLRDLQIRNGIGIHHARTRLIVRAMIQGWV